MGTVKIKHVGWKDTKQSSAYCFWSLSKEQISLHYSNLVETEVIRIWPILALGHSIWVYNFCKYLLIHFFFSCCNFSTLPNFIVLFFYARTCFMFIVQCWLRIVYSHMLCLVFTILLCLLFLSNVIVYYIDYKYSLW